MFDGRNASQSDVCHWRPPGSGALAALVGRRLGAPLVDERLSCAQPPRQPKRPHLFAGTRSSHALRGHESSRPPWEVKDTAWNRRRACSRSTCGTGARVCDPLCAQVEAAVKNAQLLWRNSTALPVVSEHFDDLVRTFRVYLPGYEQARSLLQDLSGSQTR